MRPEQRVLRGREGGAEDQRRRRPHGDAARDEVGRGPGGQLLVGQPRLGREDAVVEPVQQPPAAVRRGGVDLRVVQVGVDEARQQEVGPRDRQGGVRGGQVGVRAGPGDAARRRRPRAPRRGPRRATRPRRRAAASPATWKRWPRRTRAVTPGRCRRPTPDRRRARRRG